MPQIRYNGVVISNAKITRFQTQNEFDGNNFNRTGRKHTMEGVGVVTATDGVSTALDTIKATLNVPAKTLEVRWDGTSPGTFVTYAQGAYAGTNYDARNGPLPEVNITEIAGGYSQTAFLVSFTFTWFECSTSIIQRCEIVTTHSINEEGFLKISRKGYLSISAGLKGAKTKNEVQSSVQLTVGTNPYGDPLSPSVTAQNAPPTPDMYRRLVAGMPPYGFKRVRQDYYVQADQTTLAFDIEDVEQAYLVPWPALDGEGSFEYERGLEDGNIQGKKTFRVELSSNKDTPLADLFYRCVDIALTKISFVGDPPDIVQSFKIMQPNLFKRNVIGLEIIALGTMRSSSYEPGQVDNWLKFALFSPPTKEKGVYSDAYGAQVHANSNAFYSPQFRYDPCTLDKTWTAITGTPRGLVLTEDQASDAATPIDLTSSDGEPITKDPDGATSPDPVLKEDAQKVVTYKASQSVEMNTHCDLLEPMGLGVQYGFQYSLPSAVVVQRVEMATRDKSMSIPWPYVGEQFVVMGQSIQVNDATPDASGNRLFVVHAERTVRVSVWNSANTTTNTVSAAQALNATGGGNTMNRVVWMPTQLPTGRHPITGTNVISMLENDNGTVLRQDYVSRPGGDNAET